MVAIEQAFFKIIYLVDFWISKLYETFQILFLKVDI